MAEAVCVRCGYPKRAPHRRCRRCGLDPTGDAEALVRSVYLSTGRFESPHRRAVYRAELAKTRQQIEDGQAPRFDEEELERLRQQRRLVAAVPGRAVLGALVRLFLPALLFLGALNGLLWLVRWLR